MTRLGQHFLSDPALLTKIVAAIDPGPEDVVVEIGPGTGTLTRALAPNVARVVALETDRELARRLAAQAPPNVTVVAGDALKLDWHALAPSANRFKVIGNIPYAITSPLIAKALSPPRPRCIAFLVQREVGARLAARPNTKAYGALSVGVQALCRVEVLFPVEPGAFRPRPRVRSALVRLVPLADPVIEPAEEAEFRRFVTGVFSRRRKQIANALQAATAGSKPELERVLAGLGIAPSVRPETLSPEVFARLLRATRRL